ncbi:hypothetical protein C8R47DRAFT_1080011 [Mycena vitilis]|nr:hypothetical protein C8R47DRAFT_1080011 [Mycena vitilis]
MRRFPFRRLMSSGWSCKASLLRENPVWYPRPQRAMEQCSGLTLPFLGVSASVVAPRKCSADFTGHFDNFIIGIICSVAYGKWRARTKIDSVPMLEALLFRKRHATLRHIPKKIEGRFIVRERAQKVREVDEMRRSSSCLRILSLRKLRQISTSALQISGLHCCWRTPIQGEAVIEEKCPIMRDEERLVGATWQDTVSVEDKERREGGRERLEGRACGRRMRRGRKELNEWSGPIMRRGIEQERNSSKTEHASVKADVLRDEHVEPWLEGRTPCRHRKDCGRHGALPPDPVWTRQAGGSVERSNANPLHLLLGKGAIHAPGSRDAARSAKADLWLGRMIVQVKAAMRPRGKPKRIGDFGRRDCSTGNHRGMRHHAPCRSRGTASGSEQGSDLGAEDLPSGKDLIEPGPA